MPKTVPTIIPPETPCAKPMHDRVVRPLAAVLLSACAAMWMSGCASGPRALADGTVQGQAFSGNVRGGDQPVAFSTIQFFAAGSGGYGSAATSLLTVPVMTDAGGNFSISGDYACPSASALVYLVVTGGNPGLAPGTNNAALAEMGVLGACGTLSSSTYVSVNELTTVAAVYTLQPFMQDYAHIAAPVTNFAGLNAAFAEAFDLVTIAGHPGGLPATAATLPFATLDTLADIVSACVNSTGSLAASAPCGRLATAATPAGGTAPTDTLQAMLLIARNPANNVQTLFNTVSPSAPYLPTLSKAPSDFTLAVQFYAPAFRTPQDLAVDGAGTVWVLGSPGTATNGSSTLSTLTASGLGTSYVQQNHNFGNLAIDTANNLWLTDSANSQVIELTNNGTRASSLAFTGGGITGPGPIAFDPAGNAWVSNNSATVSELNASGTALSPAKGFSTGSANGPVAIALDGQGNVWTTDSAGNAVSKLSNAGVPVSGSPFKGNGLSSPFAVEIDAAGNAFVANRTGNSLSRLSAGNPAASTAYTGLGLSGPVALAVDGQSAVWAANANSGTVSVLGGTGGIASSPGTGYAAAYLSNPYKLAIDNAGNVWVANLGTAVAGSGLVTQILGAASPVRTPLAAAVQQNGLGQRP